MISSRQSLKFDLNNLRSADNGLHGIDRCLGEDYCNYGCTADVRWCVGHGRCIETSRSHRSCEARSRGCERLSDWDCVLSIGRAGSRCGDLSCRS